MANKCKECGCTCKRCISSDHDVQLHVEIENLKQRLVEKETHIVTMETNFLNEANKFPSGELVAIKEELLTWQDKYKRLYEAHRRVQRVNQGLEDKLLKLVDVCETEKAALTKDVATLSQKLAEANYAIKKLTEDNERYKNDVSLAIQFLQCKQSNFVAQKFDSLAPEVQSQVANYMTHKKKPEERKPIPEAKSIKVPIPTYPPTAMFYSVPKSPNPERKEVVDIEAPSVDIVSAAIMAKVLEERQRERALTKHCDTCTCSKNLRIIHDDTHHTIGTQTGEYKDMLCLRCNENIQLSSSGLKVVKNKELKTHKFTPLESADSFAATIVKVQPNNFLLNNMSKTNSKNSSLTDLDKTNPPNVSPRIVPPRSDNQVMNREIKPNPDVSIESVNETVTNPKLRDNKLPNSEESLLEKADSERNVDKTSDKNNDAKGPRPCSMRLQTGTRNILLDNAHSNIAPVLYTRSHKIKCKENLNDVTSNAESTSSSEHKNKSLLSETSTQNRQRVADWIQNNMDNEVSSSDNSRADSLKNKRPPNPDKVKYAEMEENVKRFLFGESEFLKTVEIGKLKYQSFREAGPSNHESQRTSSTETDI